MRGLRWRWRRRPGRVDPPGLSCRELVQLVTDYLEGALGDADRRRFEAHIAACPHCSTYLDQLRETLRLLGTLDPGGIDPGVERELRAAFRDWRATRT